MMETRNVDDKMGELHVRIEMCKLCIRVLEQDCKTDPRQPDALKHYQNQLARLELKLDALANVGMVIPTPQSPDIVIGLKPAKLFGNVPK